MNKAQKHRLWKRAHSKLILADVAISHANALLQEIEDGQANEPDHELADRLNELEGVMRGFGALLQWTREREREASL